ncbi:hypothetical protein B0H17DRAFT_1138950 [Mycena rosella]|uniref:Uncharacterized protein n=1 Tax=Mycena rosella TaxID=1033263 RepID=A0AAD7GDM6_MYCRO|nr:hypothetical protein B0H17DRAFT_1138950 [Mycena rosella]
MWKIKAMPKELKRILESAEIKKTGGGLTRDITAVWDDLRIEMRNLMDVGMMAKLVLAEKYPKMAYGKLGEILKTQSKDGSGINHSRDNTRMHMMRETNEDFHTNIHWCIEDMEPSSQGSRVITIVGLCAQYAGSMLCLSGVLRSSQVFARPSSFIFLHHGSIKTGSAWHCCKDNEFIKTLHAVKWGPGCKNELDARQLRWMYFFFSLFLFPIHASAEGLDVEASGLLRGTLGGAEWTGLGNLALKTSGEDILGFDLPKDLSASDWSSASLTEQQIEFAKDAALDAIVSLKLYEVLVDALKRKSERIGQGIPTHGIALTAGLASQLD